MFGGCFHSRYWPIVETRLQGRATGMQPEQSVVGERPVHGPGFNAVIGPPRPTEAPTPRMGR